MRIIDVMLAFPGILLALAIVIVLRPNLANLMISVGIAAVPTYARLIRATVLSAKENLYVEAARGLASRARGGVRGWAAVADDLRAPGDRRGARRLPRPAQSHRDPLARLTVTGHRHPTSCEESRAAGTRAGRAVMPQEKALPWPGPMLQSQCYRAWAG